MEYVRMGQITLVRCDLGDGNNVQAAVSISVGGPTEATALQRLLTAVAAATERVLGDGGPVVDSNPHGEVSA